MTARSRRPVCCLLQPGIASCHARNGRSVHPRAIFYSPEGRSANLIASGSNIALSDLQTLLAEYRVANAAVAAANAALTSAQKLRKETYDGAGGLREKMKAIKKATSGQYGRSSGEFAQVNGIAV